MKFYLTICMKTSGKVANSRAFLRKFTYFFTQPFVHIFSHFVCGYKTKVGRLPLMSKFSSKIHTAISLASAIATTQR